MRFPGNASALLVDIGGTTIAAGPVTSETPRDIIPTPTNAAAALEVLEHLARHSDSEDVVIIAAPGLVDPNGSVGLALFSPLREIDLASAVAAWAPSGVVVMNDAKLQALNYLDSRGPHLHLTIGTAVGGAIVVNGALLDGARGYAGEIGHIRVPSALEQSCPCGQQGCLDTLASGWSLVRDLGDHWWDRESPECDDRIALAGLAVAEGLGAASMLLDLDSYSIAGRITEWDAFLGAIDAEETSARFERLPAEHDSWAAARAGALRLVAEGFQLNRLPGHA